MIELGERLGFDAAWLRAPAPAVRDLVAGRRARRRVAADVADRARDGGDPAGLGEPAAAGRGPGDRGHPVRRAAQPGVQRRAAEELGRRARGALPRIPRTARTSPTSGCRGCCGFVAGETARRCPRHRGVRAVLLAGASRTRPGCGRGCGTAAASLASAKWAGENGVNFLIVIRGKAEESEDFASVQLSHIRTFRDAHPAGAAARVSQGLVVIPTDSASPGAAGEVRGVRGGADAAHRRADRPGADDVRARHPRAIGADRRGAVRARRRSARSPRSRSRCRSPSSTRTTCRSSPTWRPASARPSAGPPRVTTEASGLGPCFRFRFRGGTRSAGSRPWPRPRPGSRRPRRRCRGR